MITRRCTQRQFLLRPDQATNNAFIYCPAERRLAPGDSSGERAAQGGLLTVIQRSPGRLSNTLDTSFCIEALDEALVRCGRPEIFNSDKGCQFTAEDFAQRLLDAGVAISRDGKGRCLDNVFAERLWRSLKYEEVYLKGYDSIAEARREIGAYLPFFNEERPHQAFGYRTPNEIFTGVPARKVA